MEEQRKPAEKWYKKRSNILMLATTVIVICGIVAFAWIGSRDNLGPDRADAAYITAKEQIENAVVAYGSVHSESLPTLNGTYTNANCSNCNIVNLSALLITNGGPMRRAPNGLNLSTSGNDNCGGNASLGCSNYSNYIWIVNTNGAVFSYCAGAKCKTNNSGWQGVWP